MYKHQCEWCGKSFRRSRTHYYSTPTGIRPIRFCSLRCSGLHRRKGKPGPCEVCQRETEGLRLHCGKKSVAFGHRFCCKEHYYQYVLLHRAAKTWYVVRHVIENDIPVLRLTAGTKCEVCGRRATRRHHDSYDYPLRVRRLCDRCHKRFHKEHPELKPPARRARLTVLQERNFASDLPVLLGVDRRDAA